MWGQRADGIGHTAEVVRLDADVAGEAQGPTASDEDDTVRAECIEIDCNVRGQVCPSLRARFQSRGFWRVWCAERARRRWSSESDGQVTREEHPAVRPSPLLAPVHDYWLSSDSSLWV